MNTKEQIEFCKECIKFYECNPTTILGICHFWATNNRTVYNMEHGFPKLYKAINWRKNLKLDPYAWKQGNNKPRIKLLKRLAKKLEKKLK